MYMPVIYKSKGDYVPFVDLYGAGTLDMLKTNLLLKVFQKTKDKYCNFKFGCGWDDETWGKGVYYGTSIVVSTTANNREFFIVFYPNESSPGLNLLGTAYLLDGRTPVYVRYIERDGTASWHIENVNKNESNICQTIVGSKNYTGHQINSGEYFIANGEKYKATAAIPNGSSWQGSATAVSDHDFISALNSKLTVTKWTTPPSDVSTSSTFQIYNLRKQGNVCSLTFLSTNNSGYGTGDIINNIVPSSCSINHYLEFMGAARATKDALVTGWIHVRLYGRNLVSWGSSITAKQISCTLTYMID